MQALHGTLEEQVTVRLPLSRLRDSDAMGVRIFVATCSLNTPFILHSTVKSQLFQEMIYYSSVFTPLR